MEYSGGHGGRTQIIDFIEFFVGQNQTSSGIVPYDLAANLARIRDSAGGQQVRCQRSYMAALPNLCLFGVVKRVFGPRSDCRGHDSTGLPVR